MKKFNLENFTKKVAGLFEKNNFNEVTSFDIKDLLTNEEAKMPSTDWGAVMSQLIAKGVLVKNASKRIRVSGKVVYYYNAGPSIIKEKSLSSSLSYIILDQDGNRYAYTSDENVEKTIEDILNKDPKKVLALYEHKKTFKAQVKIVSHHIK